MKPDNRRECVGPRGGRVILPTPCSECVAYRTCRPGACSEPWGCESWVDDHGRRALPELVKPGFYDGAYFQDDPEPEPATPCEACQGVPSECQPCGCPELERPDLDERAAELAELILAERRAALGPVPDAGPLFEGCS